MIEVVATVAVAAVLVVVVALAYFVYLQSRYPEPTRADEIHIVETRDGWKLRLHRRLPAGRVGEPVFFMHSLASNHLNFEVPPGHSIVDYLSAAGYDCWTFDSRACRDAIPPSRRNRYRATVDEILQFDIPAALDTIRRVTGYSQVHWVGHSMGGMLLYAYDIAFEAKGIASGVTYGAPPGFKGYRHTSHTLLVQLDKIFFPVLSGIFRGLAPYYDIWRPKVRLVPINWDNVHPKMRAREIFHAAEMPLPGIGAQMDYWASGNPWTVCNGRVDVGNNLHRLRTPLLAIFAGSDPFISHERAKTFFEAIENPDKKMIYLSRATGGSANYNHVEIVFATESEREVFQPTLEWIQAHPISGHAGKSARDIGRRARGTQEKIPARRAPAKSAAERRTTALKPRTKENGDSGAKKAAAPKPRKRRV